MKKDVGTSNLKMYDNKIKMTLAKDKELYLCRVRGVVTASHAGHCQINLMNDR